MPEIDKENSSFIVKPFVEKGIRCIINDYDLCPAVTLKALVNQMENFFTWISNYITQKGIKNVVISGHSAGAHLLAFGLSQSFLCNLPDDVRVNAVFLSGVFYLDELLNLKAANENNVLSLNSSNYRELSPQYKNYDYFADFVGKIKCHIYAGEYESEKFKEQSLIFADGPMRDHTESIKILNCDHFDIVEKFVTDSDYELTHLILKKLLN